MATWKRFTGAVDTSAQSFLKNKKFSKGKRTFTLDWHLWNLAMVSTPSLLLAWYLQGVEERMHEEASIREEIQERTGVSSRGFLIPKKEVREEVLGMLSAGNQRGVAVDEKVEGREEQRGDGEGGNITSDIKSVQERLAAIESMLGMRSDPDPKTEGSSVGEGPGPGKDSTPSDTSDSRRGDGDAGAANKSAAVRNSGADAARGTTAEKAMATASAAASWVLENGERQGKRLLRQGRDWLDRTSRQGEVFRSWEYEGNDTEAERRAPEETVAEKARREERPAGIAPGGVRNSTASDADSSLSVGSGTKKSSDAAWRRGRLDENDKQS